jgi:hypothetical protein
MENAFERGQEMIPTRDEVMEVVSRFAEGFVLVRELSDEQGLYLLEAKIEGEKPGETTQFEYMRKGQFPNGNQSSETVIHVVFYQDGIPCGGHDVANRDSVTGEWVETK